jgi:hypothetical protein
MFLLTLLHFNFNSYYSYLLATIIAFVTSICMQGPSFFLTCEAHWVALLYEMGYTNKPALPCLAFLALFIALAVQHTYTLIALSLALSLMGNVVQ